MLMTTENHENYWDIVHRTLSDLVLHNNDRPNLHKKRVATIKQVEFENEHINDDSERNEINFNSQKIEIYYELFKRMPVEMVKR